MPPEPYGPVPSKGQLAWHEIETYCLPHFSMATYTDQEWAFGDKPASLFNPSDFSADQIVKTAKEGGINGYIMVTKHHDGFCLWPTKTTDYSVKNAPWKDGKGDMVREFSDACKKYGLAFGVYCSPWDRNHPEYGRPAYVKDVFHEQVRELLTNYGPLFEVWFDGAMGGKGYYGGANENRTIDRKTYYQFQTIVDMIREYQPDAVMFSELGPGVRWGGSEKGILGDPCWATYTPKYRGTDTPVKYDPVTRHFVDFPNGASSYGQARNGHRDGRFWMPAEGNFPHRPGWFYHKSQDGKTRTPKQLIETFFVTVGRGGSFNIGLAPDKRGRLHDDDVASLKKFGEWKRGTFSQNLASDAKATASNTRGQSPDFAGNNAIDGKKDTYWSTDDDVLTPELILDMGKPTEFNVVSLREHLPLGHRIDDWALDAWQDGKWVEFAKGTAIGSRRLVRADSMTAEKVRLRITKAAACPALREFALHLEPEWARAKPAAKAKSDLGLSKKGWRVFDFSYEAAGNQRSARAIDGNVKTIWSTHGSSGEHRPPQYVVVDMGQEVMIEAFLYLPRQDGNSRGMVDQYKYQIGNDGTTWTTVAEGDFDNIINNPIQQVVKLDKPVKARYFKFTALHVADADHVTAAEIGVQGKIVQKKH